MSNYKLIKDINPNIYRGYDIRAIYGVDLNEDIAYTIGLSYGEYILNEGYNKCVIGHDNRDSSEPIYKALVEGIISAGDIEVKLIGLVTTPMYYFAQLHLNNGKGIMPGIMITASHNPKEYNGLKISFNDFGNACGQMIQDFRIFTEKNTARLLEENNIEIIGRTVECDIKEDYLALVKSSIKLGDKKVKVVVDTANGTASIIAKEMYNMFDNIELIPLYMESDSRFPHHHPDPSVEKNNEDLKKAVIENKADLGIGIDGDGDRVGVIDENGNMIYIDFFAIIIWRDIMNKVSNKNCIYLTVEDAENKMKNIKDKIQGINKIDLIKENEDGTKEYVIESKNDIDLRKILFTELAKENITIFEMKKADSTLEDAFMKIIEGGNK